MSPLTCCECGEIKDTEALLASHICCEHLLWMPFECVYCFASNRCTRKATEFDLRDHLASRHKEQEIKIIVTPNPEKGNLLREKIELSKKLSFVPETSQPLKEQFPPFNLTLPSPVADKKIKPEPITLDVDEDDDFKPLLPAIQAQNSPIIAQSPTVKTRPRVKRPKPKKNNLSPPIVQAQIPQSPTAKTRPKVKRPIPKKNNLSPPIVQAQIPQSPAVDPQKDKSSKPKRSSSSLGGYCATCSLDLKDIRKHLIQKHSTRPIYKCNQCNFENRNSSHSIQHMFVKHRTVGQAPKIRSKEDIDAEVEELMQIHCAQNAPDNTILNQLFKATEAEDEKPYYCKECKTSFTNSQHHISKYHLGGKNVFSCPVCPWEGGYSSTQATTHMRFKHPTCKDQPINHWKKYKGEIKKIRDSIIVRNE